MKVSFFRMCKAYFLISTLFITLSSIFLYSYVLKSSAQQLLLEEIKDSIHVKEGHSIFWCESQYTKSYVNPLNETLPLFLESGVLSWNIENAQISNVTVFDNLGNHFNPVLKDSVIQNPDINVYAPALSTYKLTLSFTTTSGFSTVGLANFYRFYLVPVAPTKLTIAFPSDFTILNFTKGAEMTEANGFIELNWVLERDLYADISVGFLPFQSTVEDVKRWMTLFITKDMDVSVDISSVFPLRGYVYATVEEVYQVPAKIGEWQINLAHVSSQTLFPIGAEEVLVEKVSDGVGDCMEVSSPIKNATEEKLGRYYVDYVARKVFVYPRSHYKADFYEFKITVRFRIPAHVSGVETIQEIPYTFFFIQIPGISYRSHATSSDRVAPAFQVENVTSIVEVKFTLPENTIPDLSRSTEEARVGTENGRPVVYWLLNASGDIPMKDYIVVYDVRPLKDGFILGCVFLGSELFLALTMFYLKSKTDGKDLIISTLVTTFPVSYIIIIFTALGGATTLLQLPISLLVLLQAIISIVPIFFRAYHYRENKKKVGYIS